MDISQVYEQLAWDSLTEKEGIITKIVSLKLIDEQYYHIPFLKSDPRTNCIH